MDNFLTPYIELIGDNPYYQAALVLALGLMLSKLVNYVFKLIIQRITHQTLLHADDRIMRALRPAVFYSLQLIALGIAINLVMPDHSYWSAGLLKSLAVIIWMIFAVRLARIILRTLSQRPDKASIVNTQTLPLFENLAILVILGGAIYAMFSTWGIDMTAWLASAGIVGIAVGFAAKDTLANLFSGVFIIADAPYKIGDYIVLDSGERGEVTHIGIRSTRILNADDVEITIPNAIIGNTKVTNESGGPHKKVRIRVSVGVAYGSDIDQVRNLLLEVATGNASVCKTPEPYVRFTQFGASSLDHDLYCWVEDPSQRGSVLDELNCAVYKKLLAAGVEIPYSKQDVYIKEMPAVKG